MMHISEEISINTQYKHHQNLKHPPALIVSNHSKNRFFRGRNASYDTWATRTAAEVFPEPPFPRKVTNFGEARWGDAASAMNGARHHLRRERSGGREGRRRGFTRSREEEEEDEEEGIGGRRGGKSKAIFFGYASL